ncbi:MAG: hypothetical protein ISS45_05985 [Candidatus Omnitrophica bacterium]|nr:hypothetical protein [Candidatus Omnitrophota bacterium]
MKTAYNFKYILALILILAFFTGCASIPKARFASVPQVTESNAIGKIYVGPFLDLRKGGDTDTTILGTIRGGYGNPWTRIRDTRGADEFVREQIINAARTEDIIADRKPNNLIVQREGNKWLIENDKAERRPILVGAIKNLKVETMFNRGTIVDIAVELIDPSTNKSIWKSTLVKNDHAGMSGGIFDSSKALKNWLAKTVEDPALALFASPEFRKVIKNKK